MLLFCTERGPSANVHASQDAPTKLVPLVSAWPKPFESIYLSKLFFLNGAIVPAANGAIVPASMAFML